MIGTVDESLRALIEIMISSRLDGPNETLQVWIDTAFNGGLAIPRDEIERLGLERASLTAAILADGQEVELETYTCFLRWFGKQYKTQVVANDARYPLLGTVLLAGRKLSIDYVDMRLELA